MNKGNHASNGALNRLQTNACLCSEPEIRAGGAGWFFCKLRKYVLSMVLLLGGGCLAAQGLTLHYNKPAEKWTEALPLGNGRLGAMVFGGVATEHLQFNEETLWTGEPRNYNKTGAYQYLDSIRQLLFAGKQKAADVLAEAQFLGLKSRDGDRAAWLATVKSLAGVTDNPALENYDDSKWGTMTVPSFEGWEAVGFDGLDGAVWLRCSFVLPQNSAVTNMVLDLNRIRNFDNTYVNGALVGSRDNDDPRNYPVAKEILHPGKNVIAVQVVNYENKGGICGYKDTTIPISIYPENGGIADKIILNGKWKYFIQNDSPPAVGTYQSSYQPFGDLWLDFKTQAFSNYKRDLDISNAVAHTSYTSEGIEFKREYFASVPHQAVVIHLTANKAGSISFEAMLNSPHKNAVARRIDDNTIALQVKVQNGALRGESYLRIAAKGGGVKVADGKIIISGADEATLYLTAGTNYINYKDISGDPKQPCLKALSSIEGTSFLQVKEAHEREYRQYFDAFSIDLGASARNQLSTDQRIAEFATVSDPAFVALYLQYGRYLLISSSRPGTRPANLQGIWNDLTNPPWGSKYTTNINTEMNYWPAELLNLSSLHEPLLTMIGELRETGTETARQYYNAPGWVLHHNTDLFRGTAPINAANHGIWVTGGAWLCQHLWEHYQFTRDEAFLKNKAYLIMKEAAMFFNAYLVKDPKTGWLVSSPSNSPEQGGLVAGPSMDHQIIRSLFKNVIAASEILNVDKAFRDTLREKYRLIAPSQIGRFGQLQEWMADVDDTTNKHRHVSHLWGLYPGNEINWDETPALTRAARQSLIYRGDAATGWSLGWKINFWARFRDGDHAFTMIKLLMSPAANGAGSYPNLFDAHPPFQIDGNFGGAAGIGEMILQSHTQFIDLLPALPAALPYGNVKGICARGGFVLELSWNNGSLQKVIVKSNAGSPLQLRYKDKTVAMKTSKNATYTFNAALQLQ